MLSEISLSRGKILGTALASTLMIFFLLSIPASALSSDGGGTWQYYRDITINNTGNAALTDYQILLNLTGAAFPVNANTSGADIRFEQGGAELSYWFEKWDHANASALVWVNVTDVPLGESTVRMWYGNPNATGVSNVNDTFIRVIDGVKLSLLMDEGSGATAYDKSGNGNNGGLVNGPVWVDGKFGKALSFDGVNDKVSLGIDANLHIAGAVTLSAWVKPSGLVEDGTIIRNGLGYDLQYSMFASSDGRLSFIWYDGSFNNVNTDAALISLNEWANIVAVRDSNNFIRLYIDGELKKEEQGTSEVGHGGEVNIGSTQPINTFQDFNGTIDDVRIYSRALSPAEISDLYSNYGYITTNYPGRVLVRKYASPEPSVIVPTEGPVHNINKGTNYSRIQLAINDASAGDEIYVDSGTYYENVNVNKQLTLRGIGMPVVDTRGSGNAIWLAADRITLEGFTVTGAGLYYSEAGIKVTSNNNTLRGNNVSKNYYGIDLYSYYGNNILSGNNASNNEFGIYLDSPYGNNTLSSNIVSSNNYYGIYLNSYYGNNTLRGNNATSNNGTGIFLYTSRNNTLSDNNASKNQYGIYLYSYSSNNKLSNNIASSNNDYGIFLSDSSNNTLIGNNASNNGRYGTRLVKSNSNLLISNNASNNNKSSIQLSESDNNTLSDNTASSNNAWGIEIVSSNNNTLVRNTASNNRFEGIIMGGSKNNLLSGNDVSGNNYGIYLGFSNNTNNILTGNTVNSNLYYGIFLSAGYYGGAANNKIYNNYFNNTNNYYISPESYNNYWNTTKIQGPNIIGGPYLGGNVWANPDGAGFSQTCADIDNNGICDSPYIIDINNTDYLPILYRPPVTVETATGRGSIQLTTEAGVIKNLTALNITDIPVPPPPDAIFPYGILEFNITGLPIGGSVNLTLTFPGASEATYYKFGPNLSDPSPHWHTIPSRINGNNMTIMLTDGGAGDFDLTADGRINDPGGPSISSDIFPPLVKSPSSNPYCIPTDTDNTPLWGETAELYVTVTDDFGVESVTVDLSEIGGPSDRGMTMISEYFGEYVFTATTNVSVFTTPKLYNLTVTATDPSGNSNENVAIPLKVLMNGDTTGNGAVNIGDALRLANNVSYPGNPAYVLSCIYAADVTGNGIVNIGDALRLANNVSYPGASTYPLK